MTTEMYEIQIAALSEELEKMFMLLGMQCQACEIYTETTGTKLPLIVDDVRKWWEAYKTTYHRKAVDRFARLIANVALIEAELEDMQNDE